MSFLDRLRSMRGRPGAAPTLDPDAVVESEYQARLQTLEGVRRSIADVMASRRSLEAQAEGLRRDIEKLQSRAATAASHGNDDLARLDLMESLATERRLAKRQHVLEGLRAQEQQLVESSTRLQALLDDCRLRVETARARSGAADATIAAVGAPRPDSRD